MIPASPHGRAGELLERYTTVPLDDGVPTDLMSINRATSDIAYVIATGHAGTEVILDSLAWRLATSARLKAVRTSQ
jgi:hypothetical protein